MERFLCIHGYFYQPPREDPWLEAVEIQDSAFPHHDWNERITAECYAPNYACRNLDGQGRWGISDFRHRFQRFPEGMWLADTAADTETLEMLAEEGIRFTILAPRQASRVRRNGAEKWKDVGGARIDPSRPYLCRLPSGRSIVLFFYDAPISQAVAFEKLLDSGERFVSRLMSGYSPHRGHPQLLHIATDGETYGHHHLFGEMALGHALDQIERSGLARLTNYGEYLELHPPTHEVRIVEHGSWSCEHGIERWRNDCGCNSGGNHGWNQRWRRPLREALDWLRGELALCLQVGELGAADGGEGNRVTWSRAIHNLGRQLLFNVPALLAATEGAS